MAKRIVEESSLVRLADAIRSRAGMTNKLAFPDEYIETVEGLVSPNDYLGMLANNNITELVTDAEIAIIERGSWAANNNNLVKVDMPNLLALGNQTFYQCPNLVTINLPRLTSMGSSCFNDIGVQKLYLPLVEDRYDLSGWGWSFGNSKKLVKVYLPKLRTLLASDFNGCIALTTVILGAETVCTLSATNVFDSTPIKRGTGYIYVPKALVDSYKSATNWSAFASQIRAIEDYPEVLEGWE